MKFKIRHLFIFLLALIHFSFIEPSLAFCPSPKPRVRTLFTRSDLALIGRVVSVHGVDEKGKEIKNEDLSPFGDAVKLRFKMKVSKTFKGSKVEYVEVCENNDSGRMGLEVGRTYLVFIQKDEKGELLGYCDDAVDSRDEDYQNDIAEIGEIEREIKAGANGDILGFVGSAEDVGVDGVSGIRFVVSGSGVVKEVVSDKNGWFHIQVPAGHYKVKAINSGKTVESSDYCPDDPEDVDVRTAGGGELSFVIK